MSYKNWTLNWLVMRAWKLDAAFLFDPEDDDDDDDNGKNCLEWLGETSNTLWNLL